MLHGNHLVAVLRNDLLVRDGAVMNRDGWNYVLVWPVMSCGKSHALSTVVEGKRWNRWEEDVGQSVGERVFGP